MVILQVSLALATCAVQPDEGDSTALVVHVGKLLTMDGQHRVFDPGMLVIRGGELTHVGAPLDASELPGDARRIDEPELWAWPGMVDLHTHIHGDGWDDLNDMVRPLNAELRAAPALKPDAPAIELAAAGGVTTLFGIPGSGTSIGGFGILYKAKQRGSTYEDMVLREAGGMKSAFNFNPQRSAGDLGATWAGLSWTVHSLNDRMQSRVADEDRDPRPDDWQYRDLERVHRGELPVLIHCASAEGVAGVVRTWKVRYGTECVVSHGSWDGHLAASFCAEHGVPVNHGPRILNCDSMVREGKVQGGAEAFLEAGVPNFSLNTDSPIVPQEELFLQGTMSAWLGADAYDMVRALTTNPAASFLLGDEVGSLEVGKDADVVLSTGDPLDPRSRVELVLIDGEIHYSSRDGQLF